MASCSRKSHTRAQGNVQLKGNTSTSLVLTFVAELLDTVLVFENEETFLDNLDGVAMTSHSEGRKLLQRAGEALLYHIRWQVLVKAILYPLATFLSRIDEGS